MAWFKLDDQGAFHRKVLAAGNEAYGAWCRMGQHSSGQLADGFIDTAAALLIAGRKGTVEKLVAVGFLEVVEGGYQIHDFHNYNPTAEQVRSTREARAQAGKRGGQAKATNKQLAGKPPSNCQGGASDTTKQNPAPSRPVPSRTKEEKTPPAPGGASGLTLPLEEAPKAKRWSIGAMLSVFRDHGGGMFHVDPYDTGLNKPFNAVIGNLADAGVTLDDLVIAARWVAAGNAKWITNGGGVGLTWLCKAGNIADLVARSVATTRGAA